MGEREREREREREDRSEAAKALHSVKAERRPTANKAFVVGQFFFFEELVLLALIILILIMLWCELAPFAWLFAVSLLVCC